MSKVNETFSSEQFGNKSVDMNVDMNSSIKSLLNADEAMIKVLTINNDNASKIPSQTQIAIKKIEALPKGEVFIERFKTRIDPNTPLNRNNSYHTQQQSQKILTRTKLILNDKEPKQSFLKIPPQSANKNKHDLTIIYPNYETTDLNTCDLSDINQGETSSCYIQNKTNSINVPIELGFSTTSEALKYSDHQYLDNTTIEVEKVDNVGTSKKRIKIELPIMYLPSTSRLNHDQQVKKELSLNDKPRVYVVKKFNPALPISILPKPKVQLPETTSASDWQFKFMKKYEADMKNLNDKVDKIFRQVSQNTSTTVIKRMPPKRESSEDIY